MEFTPIWARVSSVPQVLGFTDYRKIIGPKTQGDCDTHGGLCNSQH